MTAVLFCMAMIIEIVYVFMSPVPKELENKYLLIGTAFICAADFTYHIDYTRGRNESQEKNSQEDEKPGNILKRIYCGTGRTGYKNNRKDKSK